VPYQGLPPAQRDLVAGHIDAMFDAPGNAYQLIKDGRVKALAVTSKTRIAALPEVSTISETVPGFVHIDWLALVAPPKTPPQIAAKLSQAIAETLKLPDVAERIAKFQVTPVGGSPSELAELLRRESEQWRKVIADTGIKM
jgi:tripartite-type tricarboxylate transporter receptor subunit TctC